MPRDFAESHAEFSGQTPEGRSGVANQTMFVPYISSVASYINSVALYISSVAVQILFIHCAFGVYLCVNPVPDRLRWQKW